MNARALALGTVAVLILGARPPAASSSAETSWVHVHIEQPENRSRVRVNLPLPAVEAALKAAPDSIAVDGGTPLGGGMNLERLRQSWRELAAASDADIVAVEEGGTRQSISKKGGRLLVHLKDDKEKTVDLDVPGTVVDALFSGGAQELNIRAAAAYLNTLRGEVVRVQDRGATVRVWVDETAGAPEAN
jgi:hypothetical protein